MFAMLTYKLYQCKVKKNPAYGKWYAQTVSSEMYDLEKLSKHMSKHNTPFSAGTIKGIITDMVNCITELALDGKSVKIPNLGIFWIGLENILADARGKWRASENVKNVRLHCRPTGDARPISLNLVRELREAGGYDDGSLNSGTSSGSPQDGGSTTDQP